MIQIVWPLRRGHSSQGLNNRMSFAQDALLSLWYRSQPVNSCLSSRGQTGSILNLQGLALGQALILVFYNSIVTASSSLIPPIGQVTGNAL